MARINIINYDWKRLAVEVDGKPVFPVDIFNSSNLNLEMLKRLNPQAPVRHQIDRAANDWDLKTLEEQYTLTFDDIKEALQNYANPDRHANPEGDKKKDTDIGYSEKPRPSSVEPEHGAMSTYYEGGSTMNITKGRLRQIIQEELSRRQVDVVEVHDSGEGVFGIQGHEPEEELVTVTAVEIVGAVSELIKRSLDSGADAGSLMGEVKKVFGENIPNSIKKLFPIDMGE